jgi:hypothetical protein
MSKSSSIELSVLTSGLLIVEILKSGVVVLSMLLVLLRAPLRSALRIDALVVANDAWMDSLAP